MTNSQLTIAKVATVLILAGFGGVMAYGVFRGGVSARVSATEKSIAVMEPKVDTLREHAASSERDMEWIKKAVGKIEGNVNKIDTKQEAILDKVRGLQRE